MTTALLPICIVWPAALATLLTLRPLRRTALALAPTAALPALVLALVPAADVLELRAPGLFTSMALGVDATGRPFLLLVALLWSIVGVYAASYMRAQQRRTSFAAFMLATATGNIGVCIAQDALSFYLFFAVMTFAAYGLVVHARTPDALRAGRVYIIMAMLGEGMLLAGLFAITALATDATFAQIPEAWAALDNPQLIAGALLLGFGVKAGMLPVHLWLPLAHPVAPTPASALLSGAMIKAGVLGWLRFLPVGVAEFPLVGAAALTLGVAATLFGVVAGVTQRDAKTVLAYSSISQMGFITTGIGGVLLVPSAAPLLVLAIAVYALHHALAKAALFLAVGLVPPATERRTLRTHGHWIAGAALPALVLAGAPLTSGALAKSALKAALGELTGPWTARIDLILTLAAVGTTLLMARWLATLPALKYEDHGTSSHAPAMLVAPWLLLVTLSVLAGLWLPVALAPLGELPLASDPGYLAAALWPLALGAVLAAATALLARRYPALSTRTVPAGDIIAVIEAAAAGLGKAMRPLQQKEPGTEVKQWAARAGRVIGSIIDRSAVRIENTSTGPALGAVLCLLALLLIFSLGGFAGR